MQKLDRVCLPVHKALRVEFGGLAVVVQGGRVGAGGEVGPIHDADEGAHDAIDVGHLPVPAAHQVVRQVIARLLFQRDYCVLPGLFCISHLRHEKFQ